MLLLKSLLAKVCFVHCSTSRLALGSPDCCLVVCLSSCPKYLIHIPLIEVVQTHISCTVGQRMMSGITKYCQYRRLCSIFPVDTLISHTGRMLDPISYTVMCSTVVSANTVSTSASTISTSASTVSSHANTVTNSANMASSSASTVSISASDVSNSASTFSTSASTISSSASIVSTSASTRFCAIRLRLKEYKLLHCNNMKNDLCVARAQTSLGQPMTALKPNKVSWSWSYIHLCWCPAI